MIRLMLICLLIFSTSDRAQAQENLFQFDTFSGESQSRGNTVTIHRAFLHDLLKKPDGEKARAHAKDLFYLVASGDSEAVMAGFLVLGHLIDHPKFEVQGDSKHEIHSAFKNELAFTLARSSPLFHKGLCNMKLEVQSSIINFYKNNEDLYVNVDAPWMVQKNYDEDYCQ